MGLFDFLKKKSEDVKKPAAAEKSNMINLKSVLDDEEIRLLVADLNTAADQLPGQKDFIGEISRMVGQDGIIPVQVLNFCITAVQNSLDTFSKFGLVPAGHTALLEKLKALDK